MPKAIAPKIGCVPQTLLRWVQHHEINNGSRDGVPTAEAHRVKDLEREVKELRRDNEPFEVGQRVFRSGGLDRRLKS